MLSAASRACAAAAFAARRRPLRAPRAPSACAPRRAAGGGAARCRAAEAAAAAAAAAGGAGGGSGNVVDVLKDRGLVDAITAEEALRAAAQPGANAPLKVYCGFDPTADSLHLGNLLGIVVLEWFRRSGHSAVALVGGATARIGDPSGKSAERPMMDEGVLEANLSAIGAQLGKLLRAEVKAPVPAAEGSVAAKAGSVAIVDNMEWYSGMSALEFLRDIGRHARVSTMLSKDSVKSRLGAEDGMSFTEFSYQLLQGWDFAHLNREYGVSVQIGGSDQWGNITAGTDLIRKTNSKGDEGDDSERPKAFGVTFPLLLKADGSKFGKSVDGAIWLDGDKLSPFKFYQAIFATADADVVKFLRMLTFLPLDEVEAISRSMGEEGYRPNDAQRRLAEEVTRFVHGEEGLQAALAATAALAPGSDTKLDVATLEAIAEDVPSVTLPLDAVQDAPLIEVMVAAGLQPSKSAAKRMVKQGGARVNNAKVNDQDQLVAGDDIIEGRLVLLAAGKKNKVLVRIDA